MKGVIYFDGVCNLCNGFVSALIQVDRYKYFSFAPIQGETAKKNKIEFSDLTEDKQSIVYVDSQNISYYRSDAIIQILYDLFIFGFLFKIFKIIPLRLRDWMYSFVAANRYRLFGKKNSCRIPTKAEKIRFLD